VGKVDCFCAFCKTPRKVYRKKSLSLINYIQALSLSGVLSLVFWRSFDAKALLVFAMSLMFIEGFILFRRRSDVECPHCGFDPHLYLKNQSAACEKVKKHLEVRSLDPDVWLGKRPPLRFSKKSSKNSTKEIVV
jgi:hypothetical protein